MGEAAGKLGLGYHRCSPMSEAGVHRRTAGNSGQPEVSWDQALSARVLRFILKAIRVA